MKQSRKKKQFYLSKIFSREIWSEANIAETHPNNRASLPIAVSISSLTLIIVAVTSQQRLGRFKQF